MLQEILTYRYTTAPEVPMKGESCSARTPLVSSVLSLTVLNLTLFDNFGSRFDRHCLRHLRTLRSVLHTRKPD